MKVFIFPTKAILAITLLLIMFGLTVVAVTKVNAQNQYTSNISERLKLRGVPVKSVVVFSRIPYEIEIALQSASSDDKLLIEDNWFMQLARREATLAYRIGSGLSSFKLTVYNASGTLIYSTQTYLHPQDLSQKIQSPTQTTVNGTTAKNLITNELNLGTLSLNSIEVTAEGVDGFYGQILSIQVSALDLEDANKSLSGFLGSFLKMLDTVNDKHKTYIVLCHLRLLDQQGKVLLDYVRDLESGTTQWSAVDGLYDEWYPHPVSTEDKSPILPQPSEPYPAPSPESILSQPSAATPYP